MILRGWLSVDLSSGGRGVRLSCRGKGGGDGQQQKSYVLGLLPVSLLRGDGRRVQSEANVSLEPDLTGYFSALGRKVVL